MYSGSEPELNHHGVAELYSQVLPERDFYHLSRLIEGEAGNLMPPSKKLLLESRLRKRLSMLGIPSFSEYCKYLFSPEGKADELALMLDEVTINTTEFFREPSHFEYLVKEILHRAISDGGFTAGREFSLWSAGCSTGEEPYSIAMVLSDFAERFKEFQFSVIASDISNSVLRRARTGIYDHDRIWSVPMTFRKKYFLKSKDRRQDLVRILPKLREKVEFRRHNFMDGALHIGKMVDVIFFRNVSIYFGREMQKKVIARLISNLRHGGYLFMGHTEALLDPPMHLKPVAPAVYRKVAHEPENGKSAHPVA